MTAPYKIFHLNEKVHKKGLFHLNGLLYKKQSYKKYISSKRLRLVANNKQSFKK